MYIIYVNNTLPLALTVHEISRHFWAAYDYTRRSGVQKEPSLCRPSQKQIKKLSYTDFNTALFRFYGKKKLRSCSKLTIRNIWYRNAVLVCK